ncbi:2-methylaconitate cis-trans isomerase PrpF family protein [Xenorhabdus ehlersii]|uniref:2-methylaconitate cis-trans isomerase PrpF family protein n=1 Tax=Xenorhabdus ehlersii TaxID=290111 RepID=UPI001FC930DA|nr:2-methylaconitate cis-trans isomerase PrpF family protein [Xenorhabdus ehlersii]
MKKLSFPIRIPLYYVRGGTSTGIVLLQKYLPEKKRTQGRDSQAYNGSAPGRKK